MPNRCYRAYHVSGISTSNMIYADLYPYWPIFEKKLQNSCIYPEESSSSSRTCSKTVNHLIITKALKQKISNSGCKGDSQLIPRHMIKNSCKNTDLEANKTRIGKTIPYLAPFWRTAYRIPTIKYLVK